jgi:hypothetical protein
MQRGQLYGDTHRFPDINKKVHPWRSDLSGRTHHPEQPGSVEVAVSPHATCRLSDVLKTAASLPTTLDDRRTAWQPRLARSHRTGTARTGVDKPTGHTPSAARHEAEAEAQKGGSQGRLGTRQR